MAGVKFAFLAISVIQGSVGGVGGHINKKNSCAAELVANIASLYLILKIPAQGNDILLFLHQNSFFSRD